MDPITTLERAFDAAHDVISRVRPDQWSAPSPCSEWDARAVGNHLMGGAIMVGTCVGNGAFDPAALAGDLLGDDPATNYRAVADIAIDAFKSDPAVLGRTVAMPFGEMPGAAVAAIFASDHFTHAWDLAKATDQSTDLDPELAEAILESSRGFITAEFRKPGFFDDERPVASDAAAADRLAAFLGRTP